VRLFCNVDRSVSEIGNKEIAVFGVFCFSFKNGSIHYVIYSHINKEKDLCN